MFGLALHGAWSAVNGDLSEAILPFLYRNRSSCAAQQRCEIIRFVYVNHMSKSNADKSFGIPLNGRFIWRRALTGSSRNNREPTNICRFIGFSDWKYARETSQVSSVQSFSIGWTATNSLCETGGTVEECVDRPSRKILYAWTTNWVICPHMAVLCFSLRPKNESYKSETDQLLK